MHALRTTQNLRHIQSSKTEIDTDATSATEDHHEVASRGKDKCLGRPLYGKGDSVGTRRHKSKPTVTYIAQASRTNTRPVAHEF